MKFSANLGFLWQDRSLVEGIYAAKSAGFDAVECHWPFDTPSAEVEAALTNTGLPMLGLNTRRGDVVAGENGLAAIPGKESEARDAIDEALAYAHAVGAHNVHVMSGKAQGSDAHETFLRNLDYAQNEAGKISVGLLIEPLNPFDAPGYFLNRTDQAVDILRELNAPNVKLMFDCYHVQLTEGALSHRLKTLLPWIGHIQFAAVPGRGAPDHGEINYAYLFQLIEQLGWTQPIGAEYKPITSTEPSLTWMP